MFLGKKLTYVALALGLLTVFGAVAQAQQPQPSTQNPTPETEGRRPFGLKGRRGFRRGPGPGGSFGPGVMRDLNLSDDQKQQVRSIIQQTFAGNKAVREELQQLREKRRQGTLTAEDQARAKTLHQQIRASMGDTESKVAGVLTAEQKTKAEQLIKDRKAKLKRLGGRRPRGFRGRPGQGNPPTQKPAEQP